MRTLRRVIFTLVLGLALTACDYKYDDKELMSKVRFVLELPDGDGDGVADICNTAIPMESSYITEYNTREKYSFGSFKNNVANVRMQKGVYTFMLDVTVYLPDGSVRVARNTEYSQPTMALRLLEDNREVRLKMSYLN